MSSLWFEVDPSRAPANATFRVFGTGHEIPDKCVHRGSVVINPFVWHVYEEIA